MLSNVSRLPEALSSSQGCKANNIGNIRCNLVELDMQPWKVERTVLEVPEVGLNLPKVCKVGQLAKVVYVHQVGWQGWNVQDVGSKVDKVPDVGIKVA